MAWNAICRVTAAACLTIALASSAPAQAATTDPAALEAAKGLLASMGSESMAAKMLDVLGPQIIGALTAKSHVSQQKAMAAWSEILEPAMKARVGELTNALAEVYAENFTVGELKDIQAFYMTPTGRKMLEKQPLVGGESFAIGRDWGGRVAREAIEKHKDDLAQRGITL